MMPRVVTTTFTDVKAAIRDVTSAHLAIRDGIATHAEKHEAALDERRAELGRVHAIERGIERATSQV